MGSTPTSATYTCAHMRDELRYMVPTEQQEQEAFIAWLRVKGYKFHHSPNETGSSDEARRRAVRVKRAGVSKGFPDLIVLADGKRIAIEMKSTRKGAKATPEQIEWLKTLAEYGFESAVCHGASEAVEFVQSVIGINKAVDDNPF